MSYNHFCYRCGRWKRYGGLYCLGCAVTVEEEERRRREQHRDAGAGGTPAGPRAGEGTPEGGGPGEAERASEDASLKVPDLPEPIVGYRMWRAVGGHLLSGKFETWPRTGPLAARCRTDLYGLPNWQKPFPSGGISLSPHLLREGPPARYCGCGIYAEKSPQLPFWTGFLTGDYVSGEVLLWGRVFEHERGWRAEFARPHRLYRLWRGGLTEDSMQRLADAYGVEIVDPPPVIPPSPTDPPAFANLGSQLSHVSPGSIVLLGPPLRPRPKPRWGKVAAGVGLLLAWVTTMTAAGITDSWIWQLAANTIAGGAVGWVAGPLIGGGLAGR